jgi:AP-1 complex subunit sigma 1/2
MSQRAYLFLPCLLSLRGLTPGPPPSRAQGRAGNWCPRRMIHFVLLISRQGKVRLTKWYSPYSAKEKSRTVREVSAAVLARQQKQCNFLEYKDKKVIYKRWRPHPLQGLRTPQQGLSPPLLDTCFTLAERDGSERCPDRLTTCPPDHAACRYASLYFLACVDEDDNELIVLETIHHFVEVLDRYFGNVCELDLIFNFHKAYHILDELLITGELQVRVCRPVPFVPRPPSPRRLTERVRHPLLLQEPSKKAILRVTAAQDALMEGSGDSKVSDSKYEI